MNVDAARHPTDDGPLRGGVDDVVTDLVGRIPHITAMPTEGFARYWEQVGWWLIRLPESEQDHWTIRFTLKIQQAWGLHSECAAACILGVITDAKEAGRITA